MEPLNFDAAFKALTGNDPFPWQQALYHCHFSQGKIPASCNLPTGLGKTSVIAVWLIALANGAAVPRRLVYVVNRRTVVDQTTNEVEKYRKNLEAARIKEPLAISTLRGQFADNREWSADPSRPAVICGTVDMIGSRLLFSGYGCGFKTRPLHAGFLGQDALIVHDEAHLEPAFQDLLLAIEKEQRDKDFRPLRVMELTATSRAGGEAFELTDDDKKNDTVKQRINARKALHLHENKDEKKLAEEIADLALKYKDSGRAILVFVRKVDDVAKIVKKLPEKQTRQLTGTLRGLERDALVEDAIFKRFLPKAEEKNETVYLVCTSAGEVGVNISADHLVCDLSTFESMAQRFGRVNRFGLRDDTEIHVVYPKEDDFDEKNDLEVRRKRTLGLLRELNGDASPAALGTLVRSKRELARREGSGTEPMSTDRTKALRDYILEAFSPQPVILPVSDILFDSWALTTVRDLPGRPPVVEYLHGVEDDKQRETHVAWRAEVRLFHNTAVTEKQIGELLDEFPLKPHELLRDATYRIQDELADLAKGREDEPAWMIDPDDTVHIVMLGALAKEGKKGYEINLSARTVVLPPHVGGLTATGTLNGSEKHDPERKYDVAGQSRPASGVPLVRLLASRSEGETTYRLVAPVLGLLPDVLAGASELADLRDAFPEPFPSMREALRLDLRNDEEETDGKAEYLVLKPAWKKKAMKYPAAWPALTGHLAGVQKCANDICSRLDLPAHAVTAASLAAGWHDLGKGRGVWQRGAGNVRGAMPVAKTLHGRPPENLNGFRHELASLVDVHSDATPNATFTEQSADCQELLLHLIATHHGRGRPHFPAGEVTDPDRPEAAAQAVAADTPRRFATLQRKYGRWGLAYLESLLRAADALDSKRLEETPIGPREAGDWPKPSTPVAWPKHELPTPSISVNVDPTNPGQFFACCGLLELADRLWPGAEGWFANGQFHVTCGGTLNAVLDALVDCCLTNMMTAVQHARLAELTALGVAGRKRADAEDEYKELGKMRREFPIVLRSPFDTTLDWFTDDYAGGSRYKTWAGQQSVLDISTAMKDALTTTTWRDEGCLTYSVTGCGLPFNFDSDLGGQGGAIDVGFSFDPLAGSALTRIESSARPALELLAFIGLQRFRPAEVKGENRFLYTAWNEPLPVQVAMPAACGAIPVAGARYEFRLLYRTKYLKSFLPAIPFTGGSDE